MYNRSHAPKCTTGQGVDTRSRWCRKTAKNVQKFGILKLESPKAQLRTPLSATLTMQFYRNFQKVATYLKPALQLRVIQSDFRVGRESALGRLLFHDQFPTLATCQHFASIADILQFDQSSFLQTYTVFRTSRRRTTCLEDGDDDPLTLPSFSGMTICWTISDREPTSSFKSLSTKCGDKFSSTSTGDGSSDGAKFKLNPHRGYWTF